MWVLNTCISVCVCVCVCVQHGFDILISPTDQLIQCVMKIGGMLVGRLWQTWIPDGRTRQSTLQIVRVWSSLTGHRAVMERCLNFFLRLTLSCS